MINHFGQTAQGQAVEKITLHAGNLTASILTWGAALHELWLTDIPYSLTLGSDRLSDYETTMPYFGTIVGPIANRISNARVRLSGMMYELERNEKGRTHLHSGQQGIHRQVWQVVAQTEDSVTLALSLPDGMAGLPGNRRICATYTLLPPATLKLTLTAQTDAVTCMNLAHHGYWNLDGSDTWEGHALRIAAEHYLPVDENLHPTGEVASVAGTPLDFRTARAYRIGEPPLDHNFCLSDAVAPLRDVLWLTGRAGISMTVATTEPGLQVHDAGGANRPGRPRHEGIVIEPQRWPDAPNHPQFPSIRLSPEDHYQQTTCWTFRP